MPTYGAYVWKPSLMAISIARTPNRVVNLMMGLSDTDEVSLNGSPTVSPTTLASCSGVPLACISTSTTFFALSHAPPALAINTAWNNPNTAMLIR